MAPTGPRASPPRRVARQGRRRQYVHHLPLSDYPPRLLRHHRQRLPCRPDQGLQQLSVGEVAEAQPALKAVALMPFPEVEESIKEMRRCVTELGFSERVHRRRGLRSSGREEVRCLWRSREARHRRCGSWWPRHRRSTSATPSSFSAIPSASPSLT